MGTAGVMAGVQAAQAIGQARAEYYQGQYQTTMANINARNAELQQKRALELGDKTALQYLKKGSALIGAQKTAYAASGVDVGFGTAMEVYKQTKELSYQDANEIRSNAFLEALGYQSQAQEFGYAATMGQAMGMTRASQTLLTGALRSYNTLNYKGSSNNSYSQDSGEGSLTVENNHWSNYATSSAV